MTYRVFDAHAHIYPPAIAAKAVAAIGDFYSLTMNEDGTVDGLLSAWAECGELCAEKCLVHSTATTTHQVTKINDYISNTVKTHGDRLIGFGTLHPGLSEEDTEKEVQRMLDEGLKGIKLHPDFQKFYVDAPEAQKLYRAAEGKLPILFHAGDNRYDFSAPERIAKTAKAYPNLTVIAAHFGGYRHWDKVVDIYRGLDNVYYDTCSSLFALDKQEARGIINALGYEKFLFGTDYPMWRPVDELARFFALDLLDNQNEAIFSDNAYRLLNIR